MRLILLLLSRARVLHGCLSSTTTRRQWWVTFPVAVAVAGLGYAMPAFAGDDVALALLTVGVAAIAPLVSRVAAYTGDAKYENADVYIVAAMHRRERVWRAYIGTLMDAKEERYDWARDADGNLYDVQSGRCEGVVMREAVAAIKELQGAGSTDNTGDDAIGGIDVCKDSLGDRNIEVCADNTDPD
jgi:hypothetical protein